MVYQNKHLLTGAKWSKNIQTNDLRTLRTDFLAWLWFVVLTFLAVCNAGRVDTIHVLHTTLYAKHMCFSYPRTKQQTHDKGSMVRVQYCSGRMDWLGLWYGTLVRFLCSKMIDEGTTSIVCSYLRIWPYTHFGLTRALRHDFSLHGQTIFCPTATIMLLVTTLD